MARKAASGTGTIRKKTVTRSGKEYTYWEARITVGRDPITGRQKQKSITGKTQKEVRQKLQSTALAVDTNTYIETTKMLVGTWLDTWTSEYLRNVKPATITVYQGNIKNHIKPLLGNVPLSMLTSPMIQHFINSLSDNGLSPASVRLAYKVLYQAIELARRIKIIPSNPAADCILPKLERPKINPLEDEQVTAFLTAIEGDRYGTIFKLALFTGMRESEILGLTWDCVDFKRGIITVSQQLASSAVRRSGTSILVSTKNGKTRLLSPAQTVMSLLKSVRATQAAYQLQAGQLWENPHGLVFTGNFGQPVCQENVTAAYKKLVTSLGFPESRFHDLRHTYAVMALRAGDDVKTVQEALGHASASFTLDVYGHVTMEMKKASSDRMEKFISGL